MNHHLLKIRSSLKCCKWNMTQFMKKQKKGAIIRSKATWYEKGEKSNTQKRIRRLKALCAKFSIEKEFLLQTLKRFYRKRKNFYSNLCKQDPLNPSEDILNSFLNNPKIPKLPDNDIRICDGKLTVDESYKSLQLFESNKSPGNDGLTVEFYRAFGIFQAV